MNGEKGPTGNNGPTGPTGLNGNNGPTGATGLISATGTFYSDYLYWDTSTNNWEVGSSQVHIGRNAGITSQDGSALAIGTEAGKTNQGPYTIAIGVEAGMDNQSTGAIAIGNDAGRSNQDSFGVAIGFNAAVFNQGNSAVAIGHDAARSNQGDNSIAIGNSAISGTQSNNTLVLNASGSGITTINTDSTYIKPIRNLITSNNLYYNSGTGEISYGQNSFASYSITATQTSNLNPDDHIIFDKQYTQVGSDITLLSGTYTTTLGLDSIGRVKLAGGRIYMVLVNISYVSFNSNIGNLDFAVYNADSGTYFTHGATIKPVTSTSNENGNGVIQTVLDLSGLLDTRIEVRFLQNGTNNVSQIGSTRSVAPSLTIYTIG